MPKLLKTPFAADAAEGYRTDIQESTGAAPNSATYQIGFPPNTMQSITAGGVPPKGSDLNGVLYDITDNLVFLTQGGGYGFDAAYATLIGGYPLNAMLHLANGDIVKSTIDGNTNDPNIDMTGWFVPYMRGSQNLSELTDVAQARTKLDVYSKSEALAKDNNLSELTDKVVARTNLGVYSKAETDSIAATPNATETVAGKAKITTTAIAQAGTNDTDFLTPKKLRDALNATGGAPVFACRAWLNMNGQGGVTIRASANIASVVREQLGVYLVKTSVAMPIVNFAVLVGGSFSSAVSGASTNGNINIINVSEDSFRVFYSDGGTADLYNLTLGVFC